MKRTGSWNMASRRSLVKLGKRSRSTRVVVFKAAEVQPVAAEFGGEVRATRSSFSMRRVCASSTAGFSQIARRRVGEQFLDRACWTRGSSSAGWPARSRRADCRAAAAAWARPVPDAGAADRSMR